MEQTILFVNDSISARSGETMQLKPFSAFNSDTFRSVPVALIAAVGENGEIGKDGSLIWHIPEDLKHFKSLTTGATVIMGRKTWDSLPRKPLPGRLNIVVSSKKDFAPEGALAADSIEKAISLAKGNEIFIIGGESIYKQALPFANRLEITEIFANDNNADTYFPEISKQDWIITDSSEIFESPSGIKYRFTTYSRK